MLYFENGTLHFDKMRCCQCGSCLAACSEDALKVSIDADGLTLLECDQNLCKMCGSCVSVCPAGRFPENYLNDENWTSLKSVSLIYARSKEQCFRASSGGVARTLLGSLVNRGQVDCAYGLRRSSRYPWAEGQFWEGPVNLSQIPSSMYLPIMANKNLRLTTPIKKILIIGTPCQLMGAEKLLKNRVQQIYKIAVFCKQQKTLGFLKFMVKRLRVSLTREFDTEISFRGEGWPGKLKVGTEKMDWAQAAALPFGKRLWRVPGCRFCANPCGVNVDLTLADPWGIDEAEGLGKTLTLVWTEQGQDLIDQNKDLLAIESIDAMSAKISMDWAALQRKQRLAHYYAGRKVRLRVKVGGIGERLQTRVYEDFLSRVRLPVIGYKILSHLPDLAGIA